MAEVSEAYYAGLSTMDGLVDNPDQAVFEGYITQAREAFESDKVLGQKNLFLGSMIQREKSDPQQNYNDCAAALSAVLATRKQGYGVCEKVYLTGGTWPADVDKFRVDGLGMKDYNSSDVILRYDNLYVGISLKKKPEPAREPPPMINMSFQNFLKGPELSGLLNDINLKRQTFFAKVIKSACGPGGPLGKTCEEIWTQRVGGVKLSDLDPDKPVDAKKIWEIKVPRMLPTGKTKMIPLINLKGVDELWRGINSELPSKVKTDFRKYVNESLYSKNNELNPLFADFLNVMSQKGIEDKVADSLLDKTLKLSLMDNLETWEKAEFELFLTTGIGKATILQNGTVKPNISAGTLEDVHSLMIACIMLSRQPSRLELDSAKTFTKAGAARVAFKLYKGILPILNIQLRYKGSFSSMPQFMGTMTSEFRQFVTSNKGTKAMRSILNR